MNLPDLKNCLTGSKQTKNNSGQPLFSEKTVAKEFGCKRVEWAALNWNPARKFYESLGAKPLDEWMLYRLNKDELEKLANS